MKSSNKSLSSEKILDKPENDLVLGDFGLSVPRESKKEIFQRFSPAFVNFLGEENLKSFLDSIVLVEEEGDDLDMDSLQYHESSPEFMDDVHMSFINIEDILDKVFLKIAPKIPGYIDRSFDNDGYFKDNPRFYEAINFVTREMTRVLEGVYILYGYIFIQAFTFRYATLFYRQCSDLQRQYLFKEISLQSLEPNNSIFVEILNSLELERDKNQSLSPRYTPSMSEEKKDLEKSLYRLEQYHSLEKISTHQVNNIFSFSIFPPSNNIRVSIFFVQGTLSFTFQEKEFLFPFRISKGEVKKFLLFEYRLLSDFFSPEQCEEIEYEVLSFVRERLEETPEIMPNFDETTTLESKDSDISLFPCAEMDSCVRVQKHTRLNISDLSFFQKEAEQKEKIPSKKIMWEKIESTSAGDLISAFLHLSGAFQVERVTGSHHFCLKRNGGTFPIPIHSARDPLGKGLVHKIISESGYTLEEVYNAL